MVAALPLLISSVVVVSGLLIYLRSRSSLDILGYCDSVMKLDMFCCFLTLSSDLQKNSRCVSSRGRRPRPCLQHSGQVLEYIPAEFGYLFPSSKFPALILQIVLLAVESFT